MSATLKPKGIRVYYMVSGSRRIESAVAYQTESGGILRFHDGNWCHAKDCFLSKSQALHFYHQATKTALEKRAIAALERARNDFEEMEAEFRQIIKEMPQP